MLSANVTASGKFSVLTLCFSFRCFIILIVLLFVPPLDIFAEQSLQSAMHGLSSLMLKYVHTAEPDILSLLPEFLCTESSVDDVTGYRSLVSECFYEYEYMSSVSGPIPIPVSVHP